MVNCDLVNNSYNNGVVSSIIYSFFPNVAPGYKIVRNVENPIYLPINRSQLNTMSLWLTDENGKALNFRGETIGIRFHIRKVPDGFSYATLDKLIAKHSHSK